LPKFKDRKFVEIDRDNITGVTEAISPRVAYQVPNKLSGGEGDINVELTFQSMEDFEPVNVIKQVEPLRKLFEARQRLNDLAAKLDGNDELDELLSEIVENTEQRDKLASEIGDANGADTGGGGSGANGADGGGEQPEES